MTVPNLPISFSPQSLTGELFLYARGRAAFESSPISLATSADAMSLSPKKCILVGGLSDGLMPVPYTQDLAAVCHDASWSLVQAVISSSYNGFGDGSLERDCHELEELMRYLIDYRNAEEFCLVGHSTGCQDWVYFLGHAAPALCERVRVVALQAPVSDREGAQLHDGHAANLSQARRLVEEGKGQEMMPRSVFWAPITAQRFLDLNEKGGMDDFFSSDFSDDELVDRLKHVGSNRKGLRVLVAFSGADEYVPSHVDKKVLTERLVAAMNAACEDPLKPVAEGLYLDSGNHNLSEGDQDSNLFIAKVAEMMQNSL